MKDLSKYDPLIGPASSSRTDSVLYHLGTPALSPTNLKTPPLSWPDQASHFEHMGPLGSKTSQLAYYYHRRDHTVPISYDQPPPKPLARPLRDHFRILKANIVSLFVSTILITILVILAFARDVPTFLRRALKHLVGRREANSDPVGPNEKITTDESYYARRWGFEWEERRVVTEDGFVLSVHHIWRKERHPSVSNPHPVLILHGLFQCSGNFVCNEDESLAFWLADKGYDVWLGNNRGVRLEDAHLKLHPRDPEYWDWGLLELGVKDWPAMVDAVREWTGKERIAFIGHSQGNAQAFVGLAQDPSMADKLSCFVALAPAVFAGRLVSTFPLKQLIHFNEFQFGFIFGASAFIPLMQFAFRLLPIHIFTLIAYQMFSYLFSWRDTHWLRRRKLKYFRFTPRAGSVRLLSDWMAGWGRKGICVSVEDAEDNGKEKKEAKEKVPLGLFFGTGDYLTEAAKLAAVFTEEGGVKVGFKDALELVKVVKVEDYEHMDVVWAMDSVETIFGGVDEMLRGGKWNDEISKAIIDGEVKN